jgi:hypothetical protein
VTPGTRVQRRLAAFLVIVGIAVNLALAWALPSDPGARRPTTLHFTRDYLQGVARSDSWTPMRRALAYLDEPHARPLYSEVFFRRGIKFQYAPTSLLLLEPLRRSPGLSSDAFLNGLSWLAVAGTAILTAWILTLGLVRAGAGGDARSARVAGFLLAIGFTLTYYPIVRAYHIGQIQTWIDLLFAAVVWAWMTGRRRASGAFAGAICAIKPALALIVVWGLLRRERRFVTGWALVAVPIAGLSLWAYGVENHLDYLAVLEYIGRHGESFHQNQSLNGLLHRMLFNGNNLVWSSGRFAPYHPVVHAGTVAAWLLLVGMALFYRRGEHQRAPLTDLGIAVLSFTVAAPIAWDHHYGIALPIFAVVLPATLAAPRPLRGGLAMLGAAWVLLANRYRFVDATANTPLNFVQSTLLFGALLLLGLLYRLRRARSGEEGAGTSYL